MTAKILTRWGNDGFGACPQLLLDYPDITQYGRDNRVQSYQDLTGQYPGLGPNVMLCEIACTPATLAAIAADPKYVVLGSDAATKPLDGNVTQAEVNALKAYLQAKGLTLQDLQDAIGGVPVSPTRRQVATFLIRWLQARPKK